VSRVVGLGGKVEFEVCFVIGMVRVRPSLEGVLFGDVVSISRSVVQ
jgi:hypothetical protein